MIAVPIVCGAGIGVAVWLLARVIAPPPPELRGALATLHRPSTAVEMVAEPSAAHRLGAALLRVGEAVGFTTNRVRRDLAMVGRSVERHAFDKALLALYGASLPAIVFIALRAFGIEAPVPVVVVGAPALGAVGFVVPDLTLRAEVARRRRDFRYALGAYLDLVTVILAGGGGTESALTDAAACGDGWAFAMLRRALGSCRFTGTTPWDAFDRLGEELGVDELRELAASVGLAGEQGAKVRASLAAKAVAMREHETARVEADAQSATERMALPLVMLLFSFVVFIGFPAIARVLSDL